MAFDASTATPIEDEPKFDSSTAIPVEHPSVGQILKTAGEAALETGKEFVQGLVPKPDLPTLTEVAFPVAIGPIEAYKQAKGVVSTVNQVQEAEKTPDWSKERFKAGFNVVGQMAMLAAGARGIRGARPSLAETAFGRAPEIATPATDAAATEAATLSRSATETQPQAATEPGKAGEISATQERQIQEGVSTERPRDDSVGASPETGVSGSVQPAAPEQASSISGEKIGALEQTVVPEQPPIPYIPNDATANVKFKTREGREVATEMNAREAEGIFTKERSSYRALLDCLGA